MAIYSRAREAVAECRRSSSAKALARLSEHGQAREHDEGECGRATEVHSARGAEGAEEEDAAAPLKPRSAIVRPWARGDES